MESRAKDADWYPDPWDQRQSRWWDGSEWTGHVRSDLPPPPPPQGVGQYQPPPGYVYPPQVQYQMIPAATKTSGLAIASLVLGILWVYWLGSILAVIFAFVSLSQMKKDPRIGGRGMAIAGMVLGWIGIATLLLVIMVAAGSSTN